MSAAVKPAKPPLPEVGTRVYILHRGKYRFARVTKVNAEAGTVNLHYHPYTIIESVIWDNIGSKEEQEQLGRYYFHQENPPPD